MRPPETVAVTWRTPNLYCVTDPLAVAPLAALDGVVVAVVVVGTEAGARDGWPEACGAPSVVVVEGAACDGAAPVVAVAAGAGPLVGGAPDVAAPLLVEVPPTGRAPGELKVTAPVEVCGWKTMMPATPAMVAPITNGARISSSSRHEGLGVDAISVDAERASRADDLAGEAVRPAHEDVPAGEVGHEAPERLGIEPYRTARSDEGPEVAAAMLQEGSHLLGEHGLMMIRRAKERHHMDPVGQVLDQRAQRGHAHAGPHEGHPIARAEHAS